MLPIHASPVRRNRTDHSTPLGEPSVGAWRWRAVGRSILTAAALLCAASANAEGSLSIDVAVDGEPAWLTMDCGPAGQFEELCTLVAVGDGWSLYGQFLLATGGAAGCDGLSLGAAFLVAAEVQSPRHFVVTVAVPVGTSLDGVVQSGGLDLLLSAAGGWTTAAEGGVVSPSGALPFAGTAVDGLMVAELPLDGAVVNLGYESRALPLPAQAESAVSVTGQAATLAMTFAFELTGTGWLSTSGVSSLCPHVPADAVPPANADLNLDGQVDGADLGILLAGWGGDGVGDLDGDGQVDGADLGLLLAAWSA